MVVGQEQARGVDLEQFDASVHQQLEEGDRVEVVGQRVGELDERCDESVALWRRGLGRRRGHHRSAFSSKCSLVDHDIGRYLRKWPLLGDGSRASGRKRPWRSTWSSPPRQPRRQEPDDPHDGATRLT